MGPFTIERVTQPGLEPVTLTEMKKHLRAYTSVTEEDDLITDLIKSAREWYEKYTGRVCIDSQWVQTMEAYNANLSTLVAPLASNLKPETIELKRSPVLAVVSFKSVASDGTETDLEEDSYRLDGATTKWPRLIQVTGWGGQLELRIHFRAGFADTTGSPTEGAEKVPATAKQAIKLYAEALYDRENMDALVGAAERLADAESARISLG
jgi:uncharacterized phiE125 gp8 family phage protein